MSADASQLVVAGTGNIFVAPTGTALPTTVDTALNVAFVDLGYTDENGVTFSDGKTIRESKVWQSMYAVRRTVQDRTSDVKFALKQWNSDTLQLAFGGGSVANLGGGHFTYHPPAAEERNEVALVVDILDGTETWRIVVAACEVTSNTDTKFARTDDALLPVTLGVNGSTVGADPWYLCTDSVAMVAAS